MLRVHPNKGILAVSVFNNFHISVNRNGNLTVISCKLPRRVLALPTISLFNLITVFKLLLKQAELIVYTIAKPRNSERGHRVQITSGQSAQTAVSECRIIFGIKNFLQRNIRKSINFNIFKNIKQTEVVQVVFQRASDKIFNRKIINSFGIFTIIASNRVIHFIHGKLAHGQGNCLKSLVLINLASSFADKIFDIMLNRKFQTSFINFADDSGGIIFFLHENYS